METTQPIQELRLYKFGGGTDDFLSFYLGGQTDAGLIEKIEDLGNGNYRVSYDTGKMGIFGGFNGVSKLYGPKEDESL